MLNSRWTLAFSFVCTLMPIEQPLAADCASDLSESPSALEIIECLRVQAIEIAELKRGSTASPSAPEGAVIAFDREDGCPRGWSEFEDARGRMILGANKNRTHGYVLRPFRGVGGEEVHTLTVKELPKHDHSAGLFFSTNVDANRARPMATPNGGQPIYQVSKPTSTAGGGQPHNNMPPYIALFFCKKDTQ